METRDKRGLTEQEALEAYAKKSYPKPALTADIVVLVRQAERLRLLLIRRGGHPYLGCLALPGGFAEPGETLEESAARELREETGVTGIPLELAGVFSKPGRDPRGWVVSAAYTAVLENVDLPVHAGDDASEASWFDALQQGGELRLQCGEKTITIPAREGDTEKLAFDHADIILAAVKQAQLFSSF